MWEGGMMVGGEEEQERIGGELARGAFGWRRDGDKKFGTHGQEESGLGPERN